MMRVPIWLFDTTTNEYNILEIKDQIASEFLKTLMKRFLGITWIQICSKLQLHNNTLLVTKGLKLNSNRIHIIIRKLNVIMRCIFYFAWYIFDLFNKNSSLEHELLDHIIIINIYAAIFYEVTQSADV